ncbi:MAG: hypothetical protein IPN58_14925 [Anaerolineales bacterium]|nr:hypothetical protein [Anaerolineales bacterium]
MTINLLSKIPLFADLPREELDQILAALDVKRIGRQGNSFSGGGFW